MAQKWDEREGEFSHNWGGIKVPNRSKKRAVKQSERRVVAEAERVDNSLQSIVDKFKLRLRIGCDEIASKA